MDSEPLAPAPAFDPMSPAFQADPYPAYAELREHAPVHAVAPGFWAISRYEDVVHVLKHPQSFSSTAMGAMTFNQGAPVRTIINTDPPEHTQIRNLINRAFTPRMVEALEPRIREITRGLLDAALSSSNMDLVAALATPLPVTVIAEILGVDAGRREDFKRWSTAVVGAGALNGAAGDVKAADRAEFWTYFEEVIAARRRSPGNDLISAIIAAEEGDLQLTADEIVAFTMLLLIAGNETTTNLLGNATLALLDHPGQMAAVRDDPALIPNMVEEALRYDAPVQFLVRSATEDTAVAGQTIGKGETVLPIFASANRDSRRFPNGERFDVGRNTQGHVAFGLGPHFCLGAPLARLEARVAMEELFARTKSFERAGASARMASPFLRGLTSLPLRVAPA